MGKEVILRKPKLNSVTNKKCALKFTYELYSTPLLQLHQCPHRPPCPSPSSPSSLTTSLVLPHLKSSEWNSEYTRIMMFINGEVKKWKKKPMKYWSRSRLFRGSQKPMQNEYS